MLNYYDLSIGGSGLGIKYILSSFLSFLLSFVFALYILPRILLISRKKHLYDISDSRKSHAGEVPRLGGLVFVPAILCTMSLGIAFRYLIDFPINSFWVKHTLSEMLFLISGISFLYLVGAKDDLIGVRYRKKFLAQFIVAALIPCSGLYLNNLYGLFGVGAIPAWIGIPITIILIVYITNSLNLIDGIDGLAVGLCAISFLTFGLLFYSNGLYLYSMLSLTALGCILPFAYFNIFGQIRKGKKLFMGDAGSLTLGFLLSFLFVRSAMYMPECYQSYDVSFFLIPISVLFIPCFDAFRVMLVRAYQKHSLFLPDRNHIHHKCLDVGMSHLEGTGFILMCDILLVALNISMCDTLNINLILLLDVLVVLSIICLLNKNKR